MPFLIPALVSGLCDVLILVLQEHREEEHLLINNVLISNNISISVADDDTVENSSSAFLSVHHVQYLAFAAVLRLLLLLFPLPYHSYTGTAIRFPFCYQLFYAATLLAVLLHALVLSMMDPDSIATLIHTTTSIATQGDSIAPLQMQLSRSAWWILILSFLSVASHVIMLIHVRSTAPSMEYIPYHSSLGNQKKKLVYYYASKQAAEEDPDDEDSEGFMPLTIKTDVPTTPIRSDIPQVDYPTSPIQKLSNQYDDFMSDLQTRVSLLKKDWTHKLDDFTHRIDVITSSNSSTNRHNSNTNIITNPHNNPLLPLTPFRVLLQLFAYQDVFDSGKLDAVFDMDNGQSLTFLVPQLLSFLLHGAYYEADPTKLEAWILDKCQSHVHFAHRCYWFLRAWSLEQALPTTPVGNTQSSNSLPGTASVNPGLLPHSNSQSSFGNNPKTTLRSRSNSWGSLTGVGSNHVGGSSQKLLPEERAVVEDLMLRVTQCGEKSARTLHYGVPPQAKQGKKLNKDHPKLRRDQSPMRNGNGVAAANNDSSAITDGLFWDEEEDAGDQNNNNTNHNKLVLTPDMEANLPIDPNTGFPSNGHLKTLTASHRFGFLPWATAKKQQQEQLQLLQDNSTNSNSNTDSFEATPRFLDALLAMADGLFFVPREQRKAQLQLQLRSLEVELLPSNAVYVPINNVHHRVWRIVADESIALNTKERVPCIVLLEVVDYDPSQVNGPNSKNKKDNRSVGDLEDGWLESSMADSVASTTTKSTKRSLELPKLELPKLSLPRKLRSNNSSLPYYTMTGGQDERELVNRWRYAQRDPHRGESILDKIMNDLPIDKVKKRIHQLRDKQGAMFQDLLNPMHQNHDDLFVSTNTKKNDDSDMEEEENGTCLNNGTLEGRATTTLQDLEEGMVVDSIQVDRSNRDLSPEREPIDSSMGQWTSPTAERPRVSITKSSKPSSPGNSPSGGGLTRRDYQRRNSSNRTAYGSTFDASNGRFASNSMDGRPPRASSSLGTAAMKSPTNGTKKPQVVFRENWQTKEDRLRPKSACGNLPGWRLLPILVKANDDLRQEQLAAQLIQKMAVILARERVPVWLCPYEIIAITDRGGIVEAIPDTISLDSLKRNDPNFVDLKTFFHSYFGDNVDDLADAKSNFVESLAAYSIVTFLLQIKDRHNGNILLDNRGHLIHIDFGFFFLSSPGKNTGFESAPFKLTRDFVEVLGGPDSHTFRTFRELCVKSFLVLRRHCLEIILLVEMLKSGNEDLSCFLGRPDDAIKGLRERFRLDLSDRACREYVQSLIDESLENWRTNWYDRYQRYCVGVL